MRLVCLSYVNDIVDGLASKSKLNSDHLEDGRECADRGDRDETDEGDEAAEDGPKAVRRRLREFLGCNGWNLGMVRYALWL